MHSGSEGFHFPRTHLNVVFLGKFKRYPLVHTTYNHRLGNLTSLFRQLCYTFSMVPELKLTVTSCPFLTISTDQMLSSSKLEQGRRVRFLLASSYSTSLSSFVDGRFFLRPVCWWFLFFRPIPRALPLLVPVRSALLVLLLFPYAFLYFSRIAALLRLLQRRRGCRLGSHLFLPSTKKNRHQNSIV